MGAGRRCGLGTPRPPVVAHPNLSALRLWLLGFACTVCPFQGGVKFGRAGVIKSGTCVVTSITGNERHVSLDLRPLCVQLSYRESHPWPSYTFRQPRAVR